MMRATNVKTARARASIASRLILAVKAWPHGYGLGRSFDSCFEMGDGEEVHRLLILKAAGDDKLIRAMQRHNLSPWPEQALAARAAVRRASEIEAIK